MFDIHDYPLAEVLGAGDMIHHARPVKLLGDCIETRCGMEGRKTGRDGGGWCPECVALAQAESDAHDERSGDETPACSTPCDPDCDAVCHEDHTAGHKKQHWPYDCPAAERYDWGGSDFIAAAVKRLCGERDAALARAESATVLPERWRALIAERNAANERAEKAGRASRLLLDGQNELDRQRAKTDAATHAEFEAAMNELRERAKKAETLCAERVEAARQREETQREASIRDGLRAAKLRLVAASMLRTFVDDVHPGYTAKRSRAVPVADFERWQRVVRETSLAADTDDGSGWTAEENAEFEQRYGVQAAMQLRAANDRVWQVVQELRQDAVNEGRDPYQDPMARRLSAALVGDGNDSNPRTLPSGPATEYRYVLTDGSESEFELHNEGPCGCRREERPVYVGDWRPAPHRPWVGACAAQGNCPWCGTLQKLGADGLVLPHDHPTYCDECPGSTRRPSSNNTTEDDRG